MSKTAIGNRHSAFGHGRALSTQHSAFSQGTAIGTQQSGFGHLRSLAKASILLRLLGCRSNPTYPGPEHRLVPGGSAECRVLNADCRFSSPHIANRFTVTSVTHPGLADSVLIGVGKPLLDEGLSSSLRAKMPAVGRQCSFKGGTCIQ